MWILWNKIKFGKNVFVVGGNLEVVKVLGVNVVLIFMGIYVLFGVYYVFGGFLEVGCIGFVINNLGFMYEMDVIVVCVIGGVLFYGGVGRIFGVIIGVIILIIINYGFIYIGVSLYW